MSKDSVNVYKREKLYEEVWAAPVIKVAESYGVSNVAIKKICKSMNIPTPGNGYWAKIKAGKEVEKKKPLPAEYKNSPIRYGYDPNNKAKLSSYSPLSFLESQEQEKIYKIASTLKINSDNEFCEEIMNHSIFIQSNNLHDSDVTIQCSKFLDDYAKFNDKFYYSLPESSGSFSRSGLIRALSILDSLVKGIKKLGFTINSDLSFCIRNETINYNFYEKYTLIDHLITPQEEKDLSNFKKSINSGIYISYPGIPRNDYCYTGNLLFYAKKNSFIKDTQNEKLEDKLDRILIQLFQQSEVIKKERLEKEEKERREKEAWRQRNLPAITFNEEVDQLTTLLQEAQDYEQAEKIRNYVAKVKQKDMNHEKSDWIEWANAKADWYDPTIDKSDSLFGEREHDTDTIPKKKEIRSWW